MKVLLTGASGYIGSELLLTLVANGNDVWCLSRSTQPLPGITPSRQIVHDLRLPLTLDQNDFDMVIHAAGANDVQSRDPANALMLTALTARQCAEFALRQKTPRLIYLSTFQVYGTDQGPIDESTPCRPMNDYALTHLFAEQWIELYARTNGLQYILLRPSNIAGIPRVGTMQRWTLAPGCFCIDAIRAQRIVVRSTGLQQRDFLPLEEVAGRATVIAGDFARYRNSAANICAGVSMTIAEVARIAAERYTAIFGKPCELEFRPPSTTEAQEKPAPLRVSGAYLMHHPEERMSREKSLDLMIECVDNTYHYLRSSA